MVRGEGLSLRDIVRVARERLPVRVSEDRAVLRRVAESKAAVDRAVDRGDEIYGVTTLFGGMANVSLPKEAAGALQNNLPLSHKTGVGPFLRNDDVRAAMLLRANSLLRGTSGVRLELIRRLVLFLNSNATPRVHCNGSIGASGDLVPLAYVTGCICGLAPGFRVDFDGEEVDALEALERLNLSRLRLEAKEALALMNGTSVMSGVASTCMADGLHILALALGIHAIFLQALKGSSESFLPFIHQHKPHAGQVWVAGQMLSLLEGSQLSRSKAGYGRDRSPGELIQDRYSLRCLPQFLGPIVDGMVAIVRQLEVEANSATDNPLIDAEEDVAYHGGNFLGQYVSVGMDQFRYYLGLLTKHLDAQIALLVAPEFSNGLPASLVGNPRGIVNTGLKALQLTANSLMPRISFLGQSLADRFPTHAEQFNQNINSQGLGSAVFARESVDLCHQYLAVASIFAAQAADLRTHERFAHYDAREALSPRTRPLYEAIKQAVGAEPSRARPYIWDDADQALDAYIAALVREIQATDGTISRAVNPVLQKLFDYYP
jgi:phenylalanine ammonia-lyase